MSKEHIEELQERLCTQKLSNGDILAILYCIEIAHDTLKDNESVQRFVGKYTCKKLGIEPIT